MANPRMLLGLVVRGYLDQFEKTGVIEELRPKVSGEARYLLDHPPAGDDFIEVKAVEELLTAYEALRGKAELRSMAAAMARQVLGPFLQPVVQTMVRLFGADPGALFTHLASVTLRLLRGVTFTYKASDAASGVVELSHSEPCQPAWFTSWEGCLELTFFVSKVRGTVAANEPSADGKVARFAVSWPPRVE